MIFNPSVASGSSKLSVCYVAIEFSGNSTIPIFFSDGMTWEDLLNTQQNQRIEFSYNGSDCALVSQNNLLTYDGFYGKFSYIIQGDTTFSEVRITDAIKPETIYVWSE